MSNNGKILRYRVKLSSKNLLYSHNVQNFWWFQVFYCLKLFPNMQILVSQKYSHQTDQDEWAARPLKGKKSSQWKWALQGVQAQLGGYYCFWLSLETRLLLFKPPGGLRLNLWPKLSQRIGKHKLKIVTILLKFNTEIVRKLIIT